MLRTTWVALVLYCLMPFTTTNAELTQEQVREKELAARSLRKAVEFFQEQVSVEGGYLWRYSDDLKLREGEGQASESMAWVQPPGTPSVGAALLEAYRLTDDKYYLDAARHTAHALVRGQLVSGGWDYRIEFDPDKRQRFAYRTDGRSEGTNVTTLDDNTTQSALRFLMDMDRALKFQDAKIHEAARFALDSLIKAQYPNGAWPQRYSEFPDPKQYPVMQASYPESWSRDYPKPDYRSFYTFNDNSIADTIATMFAAARIYDEPRYQQTAERAGGFILLAQMPEPQPAWAQQYDANMYPAWARKFEPPSITGGESQGIIRTLLMLYRETGNKKYLKPIPPAIAYLRRSLRDDGRLARFYELHTNRPLYFTKQYELTYSDADMPTHYGFVVGAGLDSLEREYERTKAQGHAPTKPNDDIRKPRYSRSLAAAAKLVRDAMDERGAWVERGELRAHDTPSPTTQIIDTRTFIKRVGILAQMAAIE
ncbi:MAG: pectate lyase [Pirellulaceae bacterium]